MNEPVSEEQLDELINGTGYDYLHQKLAGEVRAARAREAVWAALVAEYERAARIKRKSERRLARRA